MEDLGEWHGCFGLELQLRLLLVWGPCNIPSHEVQEVLSLSRKALTPVLPKHE